MPEQLNSESPHHDRNPRSEGSPRVGQGEQFGIAKFMINSVRSLDRRPRPGSPSDGASAWPQARITIKEL